MSGHFNSSMKNSSTTEFQWDYFFNLRNLEIYIYIFIFICIYIYTYIYICCMCCDICGQGFFKRTYL